VPAHMTGRTRRGTTQGVSTPPGTKICRSILEAIGNTPLVRINRITKSVTDADVLAKVETFNPGNSIKDRMAVRMIEDAERSGRLRPGGTIIEGTSGNTGMGLAIAAVIKGYKCIFTTTDKQSKEKIDALRAFGAEVIVCPTDVDPEDPRSYYSVSSRLEREIPNAWKANQYDNLSNTEAHYQWTAPEIWDQTGGAITHLVVGVGTGGTISGIGRYLKERNPAIKVWGIDTYGSVFKKYKETGIFDKNEIYPYITEGIGEDFLPANVDFGIIDHFEKVTDKDAAIMTRRIAREEGIWAGNSAGAAMAGVVQLAEHFRAGDVVVVVFHDHGSRYLAKMFNDEWMRAKGFLEVSGMTARDLVALGVSGELFTVEGDRPVAEAVRVMSEHDFSQISVTKSGRVVGSLNETHLYEEFVRDSELKRKPVEAIMQPAFPFVDISTPVELLSTMITPENPALLVRDFKTDKTFIITRSDIIRVLM
jgi:cystathionine beta-synthase